MRKKSICSLILTVLLAAGTCLHAYSAEEILVPQNWKAVEEAVSEAAEKTLEKEPHSDWESTESEREEKDFWGNSDTDLSEIPEYFEGGGVLADSETKWEEASPDLYLGLENQEETIQENQEEALFLPENDFSDFEAETEEGEELLEAVEQGEILMLAPYMELSAWDPAEELGDAAVALASSSAGFTIVQKGVLDIIDSAGDWANTGGRYIQYTDSAGVRRESPIYCLNASRTANGVMGEMVPGNGYTGSAPVHSVDILKNVSLQKILYFGFQGPGDKTLEFDPTCSHIDWKENSNRYGFTHYALSYLYSGDLGGISEAHARESGLMRFIEYMEQQTLPTFNDLLFQVRSSMSDAETTTYHTGRNLTEKFTLRRNSNEKVIELTGFSDGYQMTEAVNITGSKQNYIEIKIPSGSSDWKILYWKSSAEYKAGGNDTARAAAPGTTLRLYGGYCFKVVTSVWKTTQWKLNCKMGLRPAEFILVSGNRNINFPEYGASDQQDFGAYVYTDEPASMTLTLSPQPYGSLSVTKNSSYTGTALPGARIALYASGPIYSGTNLIYKKDQKVEEILMSAGTCQFQKLYPGKYYLKELAAPAGYQGNSSTKYPVTLNNEDCVKTDGSYKIVNAVIENSPEIQVTVKLKKVDEDSKEALSGAKFVLDEWNGKEYLTSSRYTISYMEEQQLYQSTPLEWTSVNQGKFRIRETVPPPGYSGGFSREFVIGKNFPSYEKELNLGEAGNKKIQEKRIRIYKTDSKTGNVLSDAEFTLYEWTGDGYQEKEKMSWLEEQKLYESSILEITEKNQGKYKVAETKNPEGYEGSYVEEFQLSKEDASLFREVTNTPVEAPSGQVRIIKRDSRTEELLPGAVFEIQEWNRDTKAYETPEDGERVILYLEEAGYYESEPLYWTEKNEGKFLITETENPEGYTGKFEQEIQIKENEENQFLFTAYNDPPTAMGEITITKRIREKDINWANGNPVFFFTVEGTDVQGIYHRYEDYTLFLPGGDFYAVDAAGYACKTIVFRNIPAGSYRVYEQSTARYYLADLTASSPNVSVWSSGQVGYGMAPSSSLVGNVELGTDAGNGLLYAGMTFTNEKRRWDFYSHTDVVKNMIGDVLR